MKTVIYHSADHDGIFCREIAKFFLGPERPDSIASEGVHYIGWDFKDSPLHPPPGGQVYVMDLPLDKVFALNPVTSYSVYAIAPNIVWIDHHKSSIESHPTGIPGYRIDGVAACRLAWQWFENTDFQSEPGGPLSTKRPLPDKAMFLARRVTEPLAVRLAGEYDIWDHRGDGDLEFQFGLRIAGDCLAWNLLLDGDIPYTKRIVENGNIAMQYSKQVDADTVNNRSFITEFEGLKFLTLNTARCNSLTFAAKDIPETGHDALLAFYFTGKQYIVSMYHASHRKDLDLAAIAVKHGGGGHRGACGFQADKLPFLP